MWTPVVTHTCIHSRTGLYQRQAAFSVPRTVWHQALHLWLSAVGVLSVLSSLYRSPLLRDSCSSLGTLKDGALEASIRASSMHVHAETSGPCLAGVLSARSLARSHSL